MAKGLKPVHGKPIRHVLRCGYCNTNLCSVSSLGHPGSTLSVHACPKCGKQSDFVNTPEGIVPVVFAEDGA